jgi:oxygen-independent coproporphyrinogen III oxidase
MPLQVLKEPSPPHKTEVGSYFISNYPPFSAWSPEHVPAALAALDQVPNPDTKLGLYLHIPFCRKRCKFCYFRVYTDKNASDVDIYTDTLAREIQLYASRAGIGGREFQFVYFGGGTPSFLSNDQLLRLVDKIRRNWTWEAAREVTFECEPGTIKESKLKTIKQIGVTRLSLGVEHFDDEVLSINGRAHKSPEVLRAYQWAREIGFNQINIDLIAGMLGETEDKWKMTVEKALALAPDSVTIYQMEVPYNTMIAKEARLGHTAEAHVETPIASWDDKRRWVNYAFEQFIAAGYVVSSAYTLVKPGPHAGFVYRDSNWHGADMIGTGVASFSHFQGVHYQNLDTWETYLERVQRGELPIHRALPITPHQRLIRELILQLKTGHIHAAYFRPKFGENILELFGAQFTALRAEGYAVLGEDSVALTRAGLLRADELLSRFFEPQFRNIRYT